jgi:dTDP-4-dehydrorhamnose 3,5-epimerase
VTFTDTKIPGLVVVNYDVFPDDRGLFAITWTEKDFAARGLDTRISQCNVSANKSRGTIRGLHFQADPFAEVKIVRTTRGAIFDVAVDLRRDSPTFRQWVGVELSAVNHRQLYLPPGCAHGYQTLTEDAEIVYFVSAPYSPPHQRGVRWNDPAFGIEWPLGAPAVIHPRDDSYPDFGN